MIQLKSATMLFTKQKSNAPFVQISNIAFEIPDVEEFYFCLVKSIAALLRYIILDQMISISQ